MPSYTVETAYGLWTIYSSGIGSSVLNHTINTDYPKQP